LIWWESQGSNYRNIERILKNGALDGATSKEEDFVSRRASFAHVVAPPFSSSVLSNPFRTRKKRSVYLRARRKALEENSSWGVSASVPYFARRRSDSAKGLRGFTSITEIHRETYNGALFDTEEIDELSSRKSVSFFFFFGERGLGATKRLYLFFFV